MYKVTSVQPLVGYKLKLEFNNTNQKIFDMRPYLTVGKYAELRDEKIFSSVDLVFDSVQWSNKLDIDPEFLYKNSISEDLPNS
jgi:hypothetical protein